jgi:hypothetical protein
MKSKASKPSPATQLGKMLGKFEPATARLIRECRAEMRRLLPTAVELVYDNYNFFVLGYCTTERPSSCIVSLAAAANGVSLSFYRGASLPDANHLLQGSGKQNRFIRLSSDDMLRDPGVLALIRAAVALTEPPLHDSRRGRTIIQSVSAKRRPRRKSAVAPNKSLERKRGR